MSHKHEDTATPDLFADNPADVAAPPAPPAPPEPTITAEDDGDSILLRWQLTVPARGKVVAGWVTHLTDQSLVVRGVGDGEVSRCNPAIAGCAPGSA